MVQFDLNNKYLIWFATTKKWAAARNNTPLQHAQSSYTLICISIYDMFDMQIKDRCLRYVAKYSVSVLRLIVNAFKNRKR